MECIRNGFLPDICANQNGVVQMRILCTVLLRSLLYCQVLPHVIGKERRKQKEIEEATGATLHISRPGWQIVQ
jgi:hypothetical protein